VEEVAEVPDMDGYKVVVVKSCASWNRRRLKQLIGTIRHGRFFDIVSNPEFQRRIRHRDFMRPDRVTLGGKPTTIAIMNLQRLYLIETPFVIPPWTSGMIKYTANAFWQR
jgi:UDP-glucose 6-dehydrogenase